MIKKHVALSGARKGRWVNCTAQENCRNQGTHVTEKEFYAVQAWLEGTSERKYAKDVDMFDVTEFLSQSQKEQTHWMNKAADYARNQRGFSHKPGQDPFERFDDRKPAGVTFVSEGEWKRKRALSHADAISQQNATLLDVDKSRQIVLDDIKKLTQEKHVKTAQVSGATLNANHVRKTVKPKVPERVTKKFPVCEMTPAQFNRIKNNSKNLNVKLGWSRVETIEYPLGTVVRVYGLNVNGHPNLVSQLNSDLKRTVVANQIITKQSAEVYEMSESAFKHMQEYSERLKVNLEWSRVEKTEYTYRPSIIKVHGLTMRGQKNSVTSFNNFMNTTNVNNKRSGLVRVRIQERFHKKFLKTLEETATTARESQNYEFNYYAGEPTKHKVFMGRDMVEFDVEIYGHANKVDESIYVLSELPGSKVSTAPNQMISRSETSFRFKDDPETEKSFNETYSTVKSITGPLPNLKDSHYVEKALSTYIPEAVNQYDAVRSDKDPAVRAEGRKLFLEQLSVIRSQIDDIKSEVSDSKLDDQRRHLIFLKDKLGGSASSLNLG